MTSVVKPMNVDRRWQILSRFLYVIQALIVCAFGGLSVYQFWNCSENVNFFRVKNTGILVLVNGVLQLLTTACTYVTVDKHRFKYMFAAYVLWSLWVMSSSAYHWLNIYESTQTWTDFGTISTALMSLHAILVIGQCVVYVIIITKLPKKETYDSIPLPTNII